MRMIDADALELILSNAIEMMRTMAKALDSEDDPEIQMEIKAYTDILNGVREQLTIEERKTGRWIYKKELKQFYCNKCDEPSLTYDDFYIYSMDFPNFCPNCGAKMEVEK